jgi:hypothetical protein
MSWHLSALTQATPFIVFAVVQFDAAGSAGSQTPTLQIDVRAEQSLSGLEHAPAVHVPGAAQPLPPQVVPSETAVSSQLPVTVLHAGAE